MAKEGKGSFSLAIRSLVVSEASLPVRTVREGGGEERGKRAPQGGGRARGERARVEEEAEREPQRPSADAAWTDVVTAGVSLLDKLAQALTAAPRSEGRHGGGPGLRLPPDLIVRDESGAPPYLKLPMPKPEVMEKIIGLLGALVER